MEELYKKWNEISKGAPEGVRKSLVNSRIDVTSSGIVVLSVKKGEYERVASEHYRTLLARYISQAVGKNISLEVVESQLL